MTGSTMLASDGQLRTEMIRLIEARRFNDALMLFMDNREIVTSAHTCHQAALASLLGNQDFVASSNYLSLAETMPDYDETIEGDFLRDVAFQQLKRRDFTSAAAYLNSSDVYLLSSPDKLAMNDLARAISRGLQGDASCVAWLEEIVRGFLQRGAYGKIDDRYLLNANWWLMIMAGRFGKHDLCNNAALDLCFGIMIDGTRVRYVREDIKRRLDIARWMLNWPKGRKLMARLLIARWCRG